jgi:hypothetical protein
MMCPCICCEDALERLRCGREVSEACNCLDYEPGERCDCDFCAWAVDFPRL